MPGWGSSYLISLSISHVTLSYLKGLELVLIWGKNILPKSKVIEIAQTVAHATEKQALQL